MTTSNPPEQDTPPRPTTAASVTEFGRELRNLRRWSKRAQKALEDAHPALTDSTISDHERGTRLPRLEWLHAYVVACLRHRRPNLTREELNAEFEHWRDAWTRLEHAPGPQAPTVPTQRATTSTSEPVTAPAPATVAATAGTSEPARPRRVRPSRRAWLISGGTVALVLGAAAVYATATGLFNTEPGPAQFTGTTAPAPIPAVYASGIVDDLGTKEGIDIDTGQRRGQDDPGVDVSFSSSSTHMDAMDNRVSYQVLPQPVATPERRMCDLKDGWARWYADVHTLTEGRAVCVKTDEGRLAMMTITKRATNATGTISLRYVTWP